MEPSGKKTPLHSKHLSLGAKMTVFGGWDMPLYYTNIIEEHLAVREKSGIFDLSHMGEFDVRGKNAEEFIQKVIANDCGKLSDGKIIYSVICNPQGGILDDLLVYRVNKEHFIVVANAANIKKDFEWMSRFLTDGVDFSDMSEKISLIAVQGPDSEKILGGFLNFELEEIGYYRFRTFLWKDNSAIISRTGYTGSDGFEIFVSNETAPDLWDEIMKNGEKYALRPVGLGARDTLRIEASMPLYGLDLNEEADPVQAGLSWSVGWEKKDFCGMSALLEKRNKTPEKKLFCFEMKDNSIPRHGYAVLVNGVNSGVVTSGTLSPFFKKGIGMCYLKPEGVETGLNIEIDIRGKLHPCVIVKKPFYSAVKKDSKRAKGVC